MLRLFLHQMNPTVGAVCENGALISEGISHARKMGADIYVSPECALCGYPPEDLLFTPSFLRANKRALAEIAKATKGIIAIVGYPHHDDDLYNAAAVFCDGKQVGIVRKSNLPNYGVFDENRYFQEGSKPLILKINGTVVGITICEDIWYPSGPAREQSLWGGAHLIINLSASPYNIGKTGLRERMLSTRASDNGVYLAFCNMVGGQDEIVFDGQSGVYAPGGELIARGLPFEQDFVVADVNPEVVDLHRLKDPRRRVALRSEQKAELDVIDLPDYRITDKIHLPLREFSPPCEEEEVYRALVLGCRDYAAKNGFKKVLLGLSGGVDSALTASIAVDALGAKNVVGVTMPSRYSSEGSRTDSEELARNLGLEFRTIPIEKPFSAFLETLTPHLDNDASGVVEENLQARVRGIILMALSNKYGWLLLSTGNKSETSVGYCTLYGDMAGGFSLLKDVPKTLVYALSCWRNREAGKDWIPRASIEKEPSAELRPGQRDSDSLPPYEVLDPILKTLVEEEGDLTGTVNLYGKETVARVAALLYANEYKRRQAPPGVKITPRAFGKDRRFPITNRFKRF
jgi:NAD+ synthase (glutamine-hydrolysing)